MKKQSMKTGAQRLAADLKEWIKAVDTKHKAGTITELEEKGAYLMATLGQIVVAYAKVEKQK